MSLRLNKNAGSQGLCSLCFDSLQSCCGWHFLIATLFAERVRTMTGDEIRKLPEEIRPISMWGYFGYQILFAIPLIGLILLIVFALGGTRNVNLRNYARSYFCILIIGIAIFVFMIMTGVWAQYMQSIYQILNQIAGQITRA